MARIADSALEEIRQRLDIAELVREYVPELKRAGRHHKARCPFHQERTPSFTVNSEKQIFYCFGCQTGGDVFSFMMKIENLGFSEAVERLAARAGVRIEVRPDQLSPREKEQLQVRQALSFAQEFYAQVLAQSPEADAARKYLDGRGLDAATRERFGAGFALADGSSFLQAALRKGFAPELLGKAGLVSLLEGKGRYRDFFRGRVLFPIRNVKGEVVGFGGRVLGDGVPKYINSPDTAVFSKGRVLYGLFEGLAETRKLRKVILLEGYMDVLAMHQFEIHNACAPLGTALTPEHAELLKRYVDEALLLFDPDDAGSAAALRGAELLLEKGFSVRIATIPGDLDPDELLHQGGIQGMRACLEASQDLPDFQTSISLARHKGPLNPETKDRIAKAVLALIAKTESEILKAEWIKRLAQRLQMDEAALRAQRGRGNPAARKGSGYQARSPVRGAAAGVPSAVACSLPAAEETMLRALLKRPELAADGRRVDPDDFEHEGARRIFLRLREMLREGSIRETAETASWSGNLLQSLAPEDAALAGAILVEDRSDPEPEKTLDRRIEEVRLLRQYRALQARMEEMLASDCPGDPKMSEEYQKLMRRLSDLRLLDRLKEPRAG